MCQAMLTLQNEDKTLTFKVKANWQPTSFDFTVFADEAWHTYISPEDLERLASERNQTAKEYYAAVQEYLTDVNPNVCFNLGYKTNEEEDIDAAEFTITRKTGSRAILFFSTKLKKVNFQNCIYSLLDDLVEKNNELSKRLQEIQKEKADLEREKDAYEDKLIEFIERKTKWEQEMYSNFLLLLNEKKKRIKFLTSILKRKNIDPSEEAIEAQCDLPLKKNKRNCIEQLSDSESSNYDGTDGYNTESSINDDNLEPQEPTPSTSTRDLSLDDPRDDESHLMLPKRIKQIDNDNETVILKVPEEKVEAVLDEAEELTPQLEFSTQDLIDRM